MANRDIIVLNTTQSRAETQQGSDTVRIKGGGEILDNWTTACSFFTYNFQNKMINISDRSCIEVRDKWITVIGTGLSGTSSAILANYLGAKVFISDPSSSYSVAATSTELVYKHHIAVESGIQTNRIYDADLWII